MRRSIDAARLLTVKDRQYEKKEDWGLHFTVSTDGY